MPPDMGPYNFIDEINRLFDELIVEPWRPQRSVLPATAPRADETEIEVTVPAAEASAQTVSVSLDSGHLVVSVRRDQAQREEHFQRTFPLPPATALRAVQTHVDQGALHIRIRLAGSKRR